MSRRQIAPHCRSDQGTKIATPHTPEPQNLIPQPRGFAPHYNREIKVRRSRGGKCRSIRRKIWRCSGTAGAFPDGLNPEPLGLLMYRGTSLMRNCPPRCTGAPRSYETFPPDVHGFLAHKKLPPLPRTTVGFWDEAVANEQGTPVGLLMYPTPRSRILRIAGGVEVRTGFWPVLARNLEGYNER